jgi:hypothetical protein
MGASGDLWVAAFYLWVRAATPWWIETGRTGMVHL